MPRYGQLRLQRSQADSGVVVLGASVTVSTDPDFPHVFAAVEFFSDADGSTAVTPTGGTIVFTAETAELPGTFQPISSGTITASSNASISLAGNVTRVRASFNTITGTATHVRLNVNGNLS